jgi:hypothetical protein
MGLLCLVLGQDRPEAEFLDEIQTKVLRVCLLDIQSHLYSFALRFLFLQLTQNLTVSTFHLLYTIKEKGGKPDGKPHPLLLGLRNPYRNLKSETSPDDAQKPQQNFTFMNSASRLTHPLLYSI